MAHTNSAAELTDQDIDKRMLADFITAWNRNYGGLGGRMTHERIERVAALYPAPHQQDMEKQPCSSLD
jgi:hypothetical protein